MKHIKSIAITGITLFLLLATQAFGNSIGYFDGEPLVKSASYVVIATVEEIQDKQESCVFLRKVTLSHQSFLKGSFPFKHTYQYSLTTEHYPMIEGCNPPSYSIPPEADFEKKKQVILTLQGVPGSLQVTSSYNLDQLHTIKKWLKAKPR